MTQVKLYLDVKHVRHENEIYIGVDLNREETIKAAKEYALGLASEGNFNIERIIIKDSDDKVVAVVTEIIEGMGNVQKEKEARETLHEFDFAVGNLWCADDVTTKYDCSKEQARDIINRALINEATMTQIWASIDSEADELGLEEI